MNRKRMLWPLLLAAAFGLGVLAARVQAGAIFLPLVARAWDGEPMATPVPPGTVRVVSVHYYVHIYGSTLFWGELVNETPYTVCLAGVTLSLLDADGLPVRSYEGSPMASILAPGERTPFLVDPYSGIQAWSSYVVYVGWDPIESLSIESAVLTETEHGDWQVTASVRNQLPVRVKSLAVGMVLYAPSGEVVGYDDPRELLGPLAPGGTLTVTHTFDSWDWDVSIEPVGCAALAVPSGSSLDLLKEQGHEQTDSE